MNKAYFKQSFKSSYKSMLFITIVGILLYPLVVILTDFTTPYNNSCQVGLAITYLAFLCYIIPVAKNIYLMKKNTIDCFYSLPITRTAFLNTNLIVGLLQILIPYTITYLLGFSLTVLKDQDFSLMYFIPLYFASVGIAICVYTFNYFVCSRANSIIDSVIFLVLYTFVFMLIYSSFVQIRNVLLYEYSYSFSSFTCIPFVPFINTGNHFASLIQNDYIEETTFPYLLIILGVISYVLLYFSTKHDKAERAEQISSSWFGYKILIPVYFFCISIIISSVLISVTGIIYYALMIICLLLGYIIYYRRFKLPKKVYLLIGIFVACSITLSIIMEIINNIN